MLLRRMHTVTAADAADALRRGELQLVDVREAAEVAEARVDGATHIPLGELPRRLAELDLTRPVAFLCRSGSRSGVATRMAAKAGFEAANIRGGIIAWARAGLPLASGDRRGAA
jgi:rhodanese-related sulfurtransferase